MATPSGEKAALIPSGLSNLPIQPFSAYSAVSAIPETAVGSANGRSTIASRILLPGKRYRTSVHATPNPNTALTRAPVNDAPNVSWYDRSAPEAETVLQPYSQLRLACSS